MTRAFAAIIVILFCAGSGARAQTQAPANPRAQGSPAAAGVPTTQAIPPQQAAPDLNAIVLQIQQATSSANANIGKLRIEKWKTDSSQRQQLQQVADSLQKNISNAVPGLVNDVQSSRGGVVASFKLYHNLNVLYEFLSSLADAAGGLGKKDEYEPLANDAAALDNARQNLSTYIEQAAVKLETLNRPPAGTNPVQPGQASVAPGRKVVVIDEEDAHPKKRAKSTKKKAPTPPAQAATQPATTPH